MTSVQFGKLPPQPHRGGPKGRWGRIAEQLRARPGKWALVDTAPSNDAAHTRAMRMRRGYAQGFGGHSFEATVRGCDVWARFIGEGQ